VAWLKAVIQLLFSATFVAYPLLACWVTPSGPQIPRVIQLVRDSTNIVLFLKLNLIMKF